ncbi:MAG TPA: hypothetical protein VHW05_12040 [Phenylobacterium sp.]|jgi:hypothetical protein|nr:hypothetical protein [Phenylobacterium sp.]
MNRYQIFAAAVLAAVAIFAGFTLFSRMHDGRCRIGGGMSRASGLDCTNAPGTFPAWR